MTTKPHAANDATPSRGAEDSSAYRLSRVLEREVVPVRDDTRRKAFTLTLVSLVMIPPLAAFVVNDLLAGRWGEGLAGAGAVVAGVVALVLLRIGASPVWAARCLTTTALVALNYELAIGGGFGFAMLWFFLFPLAAFFLLGDREGAIFVAVSVVFLAFFALVWPPSRGFYELSGLRLLVTYVAVSLLAWGLESSRHRYDLELRREKRELEIAVAHIEKLTGLLPICAWCKKVRDDDGYWGELESYLGRYGNVRFTHGICPSCRENMDEEISALSDG
jgi:hypothetical protein